MRNDGDGDPFIDVKLSQTMKLQNLPLEGVDPNERVEMTVTLRVKVSDLENKEPWNFTVVEKPNLVRI